MWLILKVPDIAPELLGWTLADLEGHRTPRADLSITSTARHSLPESNALMGSWIFLGFTSVKWGAENIKSSVYFSFKRSTEWNASWCHTVIFTSAHSVLKVSWLLMLFITQVYLSNFFIYLSWAQLAKTVLLFIWHVKKLSYCVIIIVFFLCSQTLVWEKHRSALSMTLLFLLQKPRDAHDEQEDREKASVRKWCHPEQTRGKLTVRHLFFQLFNCNNILYNTKCLL